MIARLDPSLFQTQIEQARANLIRAQADLERLKVTLDDARTKLKRARELSDRQLIPQSGARHGGSERPVDRRADPLVRGAGHTGAGVAQPEPGQPRAHRHRGADRRPGHLAQRGRRPDGRRQHVRRRRCSSSPPTSPRCRSSRTSTNRTSAASVRASASPSASTPTLPTTSSARWRRCACSRSFSRTSSPTRR